MDSSASISPDMLILGAGPSGLGTALGISMHGGKEKVTLIEKKMRPGGLAGSFTWNEHTIDYGPHRLSPNIRRVKILAEELLGSDLLSQKSQHGVQFKGKLYQFPPRISDWITPKSFALLICFVGSYFLAKLRWITRRFRSDTFQSTVERKFGRKFYHWIAEPMARKVWTHPDEIDPNFVAQRFSLVEPTAVLKRIIFPKQELNPSVFYYPRLGYQQLWDRITEHLTRDGHRMLLDCTVESIHVRNNRIVRVVVRTRDGQIVYDQPGIRVVSTIPIASLVRCIEGDFKRDEALKLIEGTKIRSMVLVVMEFDEAKVLPFRTLIFPEGTFIFNRLFEQNQYSSATVKNGRAVIVADITRFREDQVMNSSDDFFIQKVKEGLSHLPYIPMKKLRSTHVERIEYAYVVPDKGTRRRYQALQQQLKAISNLELIGRFATGEYDNSDYAIDHGLTLGGYLSGKLCRLDYLCSAHEKRGRNIVG